MKFVFFFRENKASIVNFDFLKPIFHLSSKNSSNHTKSVKLSKMTSKLRHEITVNGKVYMEKLKLVPNDDESSTLVHTR